MAQIRLENISKTYAHHTAVAPFELTIDDGEFVVLVGPSGCGKTTTLRMIAGLEHPTTGDIFIDHKRVTHLEPKDRDIAMVFQNYALYPHMTVYENMAYAHKLRKTPKYEIQAAIDKTAAILGIESLLERYPRQLSGGQQQRVALGRAMMRQPKVFLMDEPLSNLDAKLRVHMRTELIKLHQRLGATVIYVTHDQVEAMTMGSRIVIMKDGIVQQSGDPLEIYQRPANMFVAGFLGTPPMQFLKGMIEAREGNSYFIGNSFRLPLPVACPGRPNACLGLRPENISLHTHPPRTAGIIPAIVAVIENTGAEAIVHLQIDAEEIALKIPVPKTLPPIGTLVFAAPDMSSLHLFDADTGMALTVPELADDNQYAWSTGMNF